MLPLNKHLYSRTCAVLFDLEISSSAYLKCRVVKEVISAGSAIYN